MRSRDPREAPAYTVAEAARYLGMPEATLRSWVVGRRYPAGGSIRSFPPVVRIADPRRRLLSFLDLVEVHVLSALRRQHAVKLSHVRKAISWLRRHHPSTHPLADHAMETDGRDLFVQRYGSLINISQDGQVALRALLDAHLRRIERDASGVPIRLYPFTRLRESDEPRSVLIDPRISYGRPVIAGTGIPTAIVAERYKAGESIEDLAEDYGRSAEEIQEAVRCELTLDAA
jgi:uncharacterized protein (DUF433 family)